MSRSTSGKQSAELRARSVIHYIDRIRNTEIDYTGSVRLKILIRSLIDLHNKKFPHGLQLEIVEIPIDEVGLGTSSPYHPSLKLSEMGSYVIENLTKAERFSDQTLYIDALCVLVK